MSDDLTKLYDLLNNHFIGFSVFDVNNTTEELFKFNTSNYPPYNINTLNDGSVEIEIAVAGFQPDELSICKDNDTLIIQGKKSDSQSDVKTLHRGISTRNFQRNFIVRKNYIVQRIDLHNGILTITLMRSPESSGEKYPIGYKLPT